MALEFSKAFKQPPKKSAEEGPPPKAPSRSSSIYSVAAGGPPPPKAAEAPKRVVKKKVAQPKKASERKAAPEPSAPPPERSARSRKRKQGAAAEAKAKSARLERSRKEVVPEGGHYGGEFRVFDISAPILKAIEEMGWEEPSEIQRELIPLVLMGRDVVGQARTGTGKTGAFAIPVLERYRERADLAERGRRPVALVITPTRELALQIEDQFNQLGVHTDLRCVCTYGGSPLERQFRALRAGADIVVGTPGRVMDHIRRGTLSLNEVTCLVLDEADRMFDLGFREDIYWIGRRLPEERQTLLLSATMPDEVLKLASEVTAHPEVVRTATDEVMVTTVEQFYVTVDPERKLPLLLKLVQEETPQKGMVFTRTKRGADKVAQLLRKRGVDAGEIHGDLRQRRREQILQRFREGNLHLMVATDVAARGLDIQGVSHIFNFDVPENPEDYVHRVGRTARMGKSGRAITFITPDGGGFLTEIEKLINKEVTRYEVGDFECEASEEERSRRRGGERTGSHPMAGKFSPALMAILNRRKQTRGSGPPKGGRGGKGGRRGGPGGGRRGGRGGR